MMAGALHSEDDISSLLGGGKQESSEFKSNVDKRMVDKTVKSTSVESLEPYKPAAKLIEATVKEMIKHNAWGKAGESVQRDNTKNEEERKERERQERNAGWARVRVSNSRTKVLYKEKLVADLTFSFGWKVLCEHRKSGSVRLIDDLGLAIQVAMVECSK